MEYPSENKFLAFVKNNFIILTLFVAGLVFIAYGTLQMLGTSSTEIKFEEGQALTTSNKKIKVDVDGEVENPGLYELPSDARVKDALVAAGGLSASADRKSVNLASKLTDGQKLYIPQEGKTDAETASVDVLGATVSINSASQEELEKLPGVGPVTAVKIIDGRPYEMVEELLDKKAVGSSLFEKIKDLITL